MRHNDGSFVFGVLASCALSACSAAPLVVYQPAQTPEDSGAAEFKLAHSMLQVTATRDTSSGSKTPGQIVSYDLKSVPVTAAADPKYSIQGASLLRNLGVDTTLTVKTRPDSDLIQQLSVKVSDQRVAIIQSATSLVAAAIPLLAAEGPSAPPAPPPP